MILIKHEWYVFLILVTLPSELTAPGHLLVLRPCLPRGVCGSFTIYHPLHSLVATFFFSFGCLLTPSLDSTKLIR